MPSFKWNNHKLFYRQQGKGPLLLILPGNTASSICYQGEIDYFSDRFHCASLDFLGTGKSERVYPWARDWWQQAAHQVECLVTHLGYSDCVVMGTSGGAVAALLIAINFPGKVRAVIADSFSSNITKGTVENVIIKDRQRKTPDQKQFWEFAHGPDWEKVIDADTAMILEFAKNGGDWFSGKLREIKCPVLLTISEEDKTFPNMIQNVKRMSKEIANCKVFINDCGGHPLIWSASQAFHLSVDDFLTSIR